MEGLLAGLQYYMEIGESVCAEGSLDLDGYGQCGCLRGVPASIDVYLDTGTDSLPQEVLDYVNRHCNPYVWALHHRVDTQQPTMNVHQRPP